MTVIETFDPAFLADPYPTYAAIRETTPVHEVHPGFFRLVGYEDAALVFKHPNASADRGGSDFGDADERLLTAARTVDRHLDTWMLMRDPPDHTRLRSLVAKAFTPRVVERLRGGVEAIVAELLADAGPGVELDLIATLAYPLPTRVIAELIGLPVEDADDFKRWSNDIAAIIGNAALAPNRDELYDRADDSIRAVSAYMQELIAARRSDPREDLLTGLIAAEEAGSHLSSDELIGTTVMLLFAGHETTTNLIGNGTLALLAHPHELRRLRDDPDLLPIAIEELLRYDSPVQATGRSLTGPVELPDGTVLPTGAALGIWIGGANRDPAVFDDPDRLDVGRRGARHLSFAHGPHYCIGAALARLEAEVAFGHLLWRLPEFELAGETPWRRNPILRGVERLPIRFG
ncbi:MAG TPA: cytochrome P450 [Gaiellaceae bacterium]|jgi:hypothetical protein